MLSVALDSHLSRENEGGDICDRAMRLAAFPGQCGYKSETGGRLKELRELTNATVREYHKAYYRRLGSDFGVMNHQFSTVYTVSRYNCDKMDAVLINLL